MSRIVNRESDRLDRTVNRFLEYSHRRTQNRCSACDASRGVQEVMEMVQQRSDCSSMTFHTGVVPEISVAVDGDSWNSIVSNLMINAVEACQGSGHLDVSLTPMDGMALLMISDDGPGIPEDLQSRIFHPFMTTKSREGGLGLAIVRKAVEESGGRIEIDSTVGNGTTMKVVVPLIEILEHEEVKAGQA